RRTPTLLPVAGHAGSDDVLPVFPAALGDRQHMIERQIAGWEQFSTVLAAMVVARVDICAREWHVIESSLDLDVPQQPDDGWQLETERNGADLSVVHRNNLDLALAPKRDRFLPVHDFERFVRRVEQERLFHQPDHRLRSARAGAAESFELCPTA